MRARRKALLTLVTWAVVLAGGAAPAFATELVLSRPGRQRLVSTGTAQFHERTRHREMRRHARRLIQQSDSADVRRPGRLDLQRHRERLQRRGKIVGHVPVAAVDDEIQIGRRVPARSAERSFVTIVNGVAASITSSGVTCLYRGDVGMSMGVSGTNPYAIGSVSTLTNSLSLVSGAFCPRSASMNGSFRFSAEEEIGELPGNPLSASP